MPTFNVTVPVAGHAYLEIEAENEEAAIEQAMGEIKQEHIDSWEPLRQFNRGNVCYCPQPWDAEAEQVD